MSEFKKSKFSNSRPNTPRAFSRGPSSRPSFGGGAPRFNSSRDSGSSESFKTTCSKCNKACEVPFKPNGKKPVFCRDCFVRDDAPRGNDASYEKRSYGNDRGTERSDRFSERAYTPKPVASEDPRISALQKELATVHAKLDMLIGTLQGAAYSSILAKTIERDATESGEVKVVKTSAPVKALIKTSLLKKAVKKVSKKNA